jgi:hypothetical protein
MSPLSACCQMVTSMGALGGQRYRASDLVLWPTAFIRGAWRSRLLRDPKAAVLQMMNFKMSSPLTACTATRAGTVVTQHLFTCVGGGAVCSGSAQARLLRRSPPFRRQRTLCRILTTSIFDGTHAPARKADLEDRRIRSSRRKGRPFAAREASPQSPRRPRRDLGEGADDRVAAARQFRTCARSKPICSTENPFGRSRASLTPSANVSRFVGGYERTRN